MRLGVKAALVNGRVVEGDVAINSGLIESVGLSPAGRNGLAVPGFIDVQINGFDGVDFTTAPMPTIRLSRVPAPTSLTSHDSTIGSLSSALRSGSGPATNST